MQKKCCARFEGRTLELFVHTFLRPFDRSSGVLYVHVTRITNLIASRLVVIIDVLFVDAARHDVDPKPRTNPSESENRIIVSTVKKVRSFRICVSSTGALLLTSSYQATIIFGPLPSLGRTLWTQ